MPATDRCWDQTEELTLLTRHAEVTVALSRASLTSIRVPGPAALMLEAVSIVDMGIEPIVDEAASAWRLAGSGAFDGGWSCTLRRCWNDGAIHQRRIVKALRQGGIWLEDTVSNGSDALLAVETALTLEAGPGVRWERATHHGLDDEAGTGPHVVGAYRWSRSGSHQLDVLEAVRRDLAPGADIEHRLILEGAFDRT